MAQERICPTRYEMHEGRMHDEVLGFTNIYYFDDNTCRDGILAWIRKHHTDSKNGRLFSSMGWF